MINYYTILYNLIQVQNRIDIHTALVIGLKKDENTVSSTKMNFRPAEVDFVH